MNSLLQLGGPALEPLLAQGYPSYLVGGAVRDSLLGLPIHDLDVATAARPEEVKAVFAGQRLVETGLRHGTLTLVTERGPVEITTFRREGAYSDHRRPDDVTFTTRLEEDLGRRDFTINAMALGKEGLVDPFGGQEDLSRRLLRCVGEPEARFDEDALRILRGLRLAACLDFVLEKRTARAIREGAHLLEHIARERVSAELTRLLCGGAAQRVLLEFPEVMTAVVPELAPAVGFDQRTPYHSYDVYAHTARVVGQVPATPVLRLAALLHDVAKPSTFRPDGKGVGHFPHHAPKGAEMAEDIMRRLRLDNETRRQVIALIRRHSKAPRMGERDVPALLAELGPELFAMFLELGRGDSLAKSPRGMVPQAHWDRLARRGRELLGEGFCLSVRDLAVSGTDAMAAGLTGPAVGEAMRNLLRRVQQGEIENRREVLLEQLRRDPTGNS